MKKGPQIFEAICESLTQSPKFSVAARKVGLSEKQLYVWLGKSQQGDPSFLFKYLDDEPTPLHIAVKMAQQMYVQAFVQDSEHAARFGEYRQTYFKGQPCWQQDPKLLSWSDDDLQRLGLDRYLRDERGNLIPVMEWHPPSAQLRLAALAARMPKVYGTRITHDVNQKVNLGVHVVNNQKALPPMPVEIVTPPLAITDDSSAEVEAGDFTELPAEPEIDIGLDDVDTAEPIVDEIEQPEPVGNPNISREPSPLRRQLEELAAKLPKPDTVEPVVDEQPVVSAGGNPAVSHAPSQLRQELEALARARAAGR